MKFDIWGFFENLSRKFKLHLNRKKKAGTLHEDQHTFLIISRSFLLRMRNVSDKSCRENRNTYFVCNNSHPLPKSCRLWDNVEKYNRAGTATYENMAHAHCYKYTHNLCNTHCFPTATMVERTRVNVTFYVQWLSCYGISLNSFRTVLMHQFRHNLQD